MKKFFLVFYLFVFWCSAGCSNVDPYDYEIKDKVCPGYNDLLNSFVEDLKNEKYPFVVSFFEGLDYGIKRKIIETSVRFLKRSYNTIKKGKLADLKLKSSFSNKLHLQPVFDVIYDIKSECDVYDFLKVVKPMFLDCDFQISFLNIINKNKIVEFMKYFAGKDEISKDDIKSFLSLLITIFSNSNLSLKIPIVDDYDDKDFQIVFKKLEKVLSNSESKEVFTSFFSCLNSISQKDEFLTIGSTLLYDFPFEVKVIDSERLCVFSSEFFDFFMKDTDAYPLACELFDRFYSFSNYHSLLEEFSNFLSTESFDQLKALLEHKAQCR